MPHITKDIIIQNKLGLHARPASQLAQISAQYQSQITLSIADKSADASSVLGLMLLAGSQGKTVTVDVQGDDAADALHAVETLFCAKFLEEDQ